MNHEDALRELSVERYLLGELTGDARDAFEDHLFECRACAEDLKSGSLLLEGVRQDALMQEGPVTSPAVVPTDRKPSLLSRWFFNPVWMSPALAACLAVVLYQSVFQIPRLEQQVAEANTPEVLNNLLIAGGTSRGDSTQTITAREGHSFLLSADIPASSTYASYRLSLASSSGKVYWRGNVTAEQAKDTVQIRVPASAAQAGENTLVIEGVSVGSGTGAAAEIVSTRRFILEISK